MRKLFLLLFFAISSASANFSWTPTVTLSDPTSQTDSPSVALDANGNAVAVWRALLLNGELIIQAATKLYGQPWSAAETISPLGELTGAPLVHVDANGNAVAIWITSAGGQSIRSANKLFGQPWSAVDLVPGSAAGVDFDFAVAPDGNVTLMWGTSPANTVLASERTLLGAWSAVPITLSVGMAFLPQVGVDASGNIIGTWQEDTNILFARKSFGSLVWGPVLTAYGLGGAGEPMISVNLAGDAAIIWSGTAGVGAVYVPANQAADPAQIIPGSSTDPDSRPNIGLDNNRNAIAVWFDNSNVNLSSIKLFGQSWSTPSLFASPGAQIRPSIDVNDCNLTLISFQGSQGTEVTSGIIGSSFSAPFLLGGDSLSGAAAIDQGPCGHAMALFEGSILASEGLLLSNVTSFSGSQRKNNFGTLSEYENRLRWTINSTLGVAGFQIYRNGSPLAFVKANKDKYVDPGQVKNEPVQYGIASVDSQGAETSQTIITVP